MEKTKIAIFLIVAILLNSCTVTRKYHGQYSYFWENNQPVVGKVFIKNTYFPYTYKAPSKHFKMIDRLTLPENVLFLGNTVDQEIYTTK